jgi:hypothetical protein
MAIARHSLNYCFNPRVPGITVFDRLLPEGNPIDEFLEHKCKHTEGWFVRERSKLGDAKANRKILMTNFRNHVNPFSSIVREIKV